MASHNREQSTPFLIRLFYKNGSFHRPEEFGSRPLPPSLSLYTWPNCTLNELAHQIAAEGPSLLPSPSVGTRLAFRLIYPDARNTAASAGHHHHAALQPRFMVKDLGSVVLGEGGANAGQANGGGDGQEQQEREAVGGPDRDVEMAWNASAALGQPSAGMGESSGARDKTLGEAKFVVGDYISCAILPPLADGSVASALTAARSDRTANSLNARGPGAAGQPSHGGARRDAGYGGGRPMGRDRRRSGGGGFPEGEWRRGERLPDDPPDRSRGRGRRTGW